MKTINEITVSRIFILLFLISCASKPEQKKNEAVDSTTAGRNGTSELKLASSTTSLDHPKHEEDENYPWYDTPKIGDWIQVHRLEQIKSSFHNNLHISITELVQQFVACDSLPIFLEIEGCAKDNVFYLKNTACADKYVSRSSVDVLSGDTFLLENKSPDSTYRLLFQNENNLSINSIRFIKTDLDYELDRFLKGNYEVYDAQNVLLDKIEYNSTFNTDSKIFASLKFNAVGFYVRAENKPKIANADLISVSLFTGKMKKDEQEEYRETIHYLFELIRTPTGFELHNGFDGINNVFREGLCYRLRRV